MIKAGIEFARQNERKTATGLILTDASGREWRKLHGCYSRSEGKVLNVYSPLSTAATTAPWYAKWRLVASRAGRHAQPVLTNTIPPDVPTDDRCWERAMVWAADHARIVATVFHAGAEDIDAAVGQWRGDTARAPAASWYHWPDLIESSIELAGLLKRLAAIKEPAGPVETVAAVEDACQSSRKGPLTKAESKTKRIQMIAMVSQHPTLQDDPTELAKQFGVHRTTVDRWLEQFRRKANL